jgi:hypothetical protein
MCDKHANSCRTFFSGHDMPKPKVLSLRLVVPLNPTTCTEQSSITGLMSSLCKKNFAAGDENDEKSFNSRPIVKGLAVALGEKARRTHEVPGLSKVEQ